MPPRYSPGSDQSPDTEALAGLYGSWTDARREERAAQTTLSPEDLTRLAAIIGTLQTTFLVGDEKVTAAHLAKDIREGTARGQEFAQTHGRMWLNLPDVPAQQTAALQTIREQSQEAQTATLRTLDVISLPVVDAEAQVVKEPLTGLTAEEIERIASLYERANLTFSVDGHTKHPKDFAADIRNLTELGREFLQSAGRDFLSMTAGETMAAEDDESAWQAVYNERLAGIQARIKALQPPEGKLPKVSE